MAWIFAIIFILFLIVLSSCFSNDEKKKYQEYKKQGLEYIKKYYNVSYYGGFKDIGFRKDENLILFEDRIRILNKDILIKNIKDCRIQTETQLTERASIGKLLCFGVFALGMKGKQKELNKEFTVIRFSNNNEEADLIVDLKSKNEIFIGKINRLMRVNDGINNNCICQNGTENLYN